MTDKQFKELTDLISKSVNNTYNAGVIIENFTKMYNSNLSNIDSKYERIIKTQKILNDKLDKLLLNK